MAEKVERSIIRDCLSLLVSLTERSIVLGKTRTGVIQTTYADATKKTYQGEIKCFSSFESALENVSISDLDCETAFANTKSSKVSLARYILHSLEAGHANDAEPWYVVNDDLAEITLEHILPKSVKAVDWPSFNIDTHRQFKTRLGNLCLL